METSAADIAPYNKCNGVTDLREELLELIAELKANKQRKIADPSALCTAAFSLTNFLLAVVQLKLVPASFLQIVAPQALFYGGAVQFVYGLVCCFTNNMFGVMVYPSFGAFWIALGFLITMEGEKVYVFGGNEGNHALGFLLVGWLIYSIFLWIATFTHHVAAVGAFTSLVIMLILYILADFGVIHSTIPGGIFGLSLSGFGWYVALAVLVNDNCGCTVFPLGEFNRIPFLDRTGKMFRSR
ncbi:Ammonia transport outward protein 2 [Galdieria sulphuraria]|uniref:Putative acetate transporter n=1 Tax=Galdieria sulphuraria TaxID=130081 RepID=M2XZA4_GALSU|nr:putative acetate transporter [Galdieria sulphuraria]EME28978.1 putative acetate transporter [Galdieria sulphuraria]GJD06915.1 Ammonia transport outward protein 2 [Galdieria sulphuraria]|eukprot:XP_005705498.1 putative acetate transporter [Galdieria sulphuraria]